MPRDTRNDWHDDWRHDDPAPMTWSDYAFIVGAVLVLVLVVCIVPVLHGY